MGQIIKKHYLKITFQLDSPLCVGSGRNDITDHDILRDGRGIPYIPGSAVAGVVREACYEAYQGIMEEETFKYYFGDAPINTGKEDNSEDKIIESRIIFFDAVLAEDKTKEAQNPQRPKYRIFQRDGVALNKYKSAKKQSKFDWEILEGDCLFNTFIEISEEKLNADKEGNLTVNAEEVLINIARIWKNADISFGAKTTRGFGKITNVKIICKSFNLSHNTDGEKKGYIEDWLDFDMFNDASWEDGKSYENMVNSLEEKKLTIKEKKKLSLKLRLDGGLSIRRYTTECGAEKSSTNSKLLSAQESSHDHESLPDKESGPDQEQMTTLISEKEVPVIPGTTWAGAIGHRMEELLKGSKVVKDRDNVRTYHYFGMAKDNEKEKSLIYFGESRLTGGNFKLMSRNAIDRFLGSTVERALFTEKIYIGGETVLEISFSDPYKTAVYYSEEFIKALAAALTDLHEGYLAVGGATSIGRGIFSITHINNEELKAYAESKKEDENSLEKEKQSTVFNILYKTLKELLKKKEKQYGKSESFIK